MCSPGQFGRKQHTIRRTRFRTTRDLAPQRFAQNFRLANTATIGTPMGALGSVHILLN